MKKILVIGGSGFLGSKIVNSLETFSYRNVFIGTRNPKKIDEYYFSWNSCDFEDCIKDFDIFINTADFLVNPEITFFFDKILKKNKLFVDTCANEENINFFLNLMESRIFNNDEHNGYIFFGAGVFPGISNLLVNYHLLNYPKEENLNLGIRYSIFSGAGLGMCKMMAETLTKPSKRKLNNAIFKGKPVESLKDFFWKDGKKVAMQVYLSDLEFWIKNERIKSFSTYLSIKPYIFNFFSTPINFLSRFNFMQKFYSLFFFLLRGVILKYTETKMQILVKSENNQSLIYLEEPFEAGTLGIVTLLEKKFNIDNKVSAGVHSFGDVIEISELLDSYRKKTTSLCKIEFYNNITNEPTI